MSKSVEANEASPSKLWSKLKGTTWTESNGWAGKGLTFFEDTKGRRKCLLQTYGSGVYVTSSSFIYVAVKSDKAINIGMDGYLPEAGVTPEPKFFTTFELTRESELVAGKRTLKLSSGKLVIYNRKGLIPLESLRGENFDPASLQK